MAERVTSPVTQMDTSVPRYARPIVIVSLFIAIAIYIVTPILAYNWALRIPFLGALLEQTYNVNDVRGDTWGPSPDRLDVQYHIESIDGRVIDSQTALDEALLAGGASGEDPVRVTYLKQTPQGVVSDTISLRLRTFPLRDMLQLFWLPYVIGLTYLAIGIWVFRLRGRQRAGFTFTLFTTWVAILLGVLFDLYSTHVLSFMWPIAFAITGASIFQLASVFPQEARFVQGRPILRFLPVIPAAVFAVNALAVLSSQSDPWAYIGSWRSLYLFAVLGLLVFYAILVYRRVASRSPVARQQSRIILWGSFPAFLPFSAWAVLGLLGFDVPFIALIILGPLVLFPLAVAYALVRYRLLNVDELITRSLTYVVLTGIVVSIYFLFVSLLGGLLQSEQSLAANPALLAVFIIVIAVLLEPLRQRVQRGVDRIFFRGRIDARGVLQAYSGDLTGVVDLDSIVNLLSDVINQTLKPEHVRPYLYDARSRSYRLHSVEPEQENVSVLVLRCSEDNPLVYWLRDQSDPWHVQPDQPLPESIKTEGARLRAMDAVLFVPLRGSNRLDGWIVLSNKASGQPYTAEEMTFLGALAGQTVLALERALTFDNLERRVSELNVLSQISQAINFKVNIDDILELIYAQTGRVLDTSNFYIAMIDERRDTMHFEFYVENNERLYPDDEWPIEMGLNGVIIRTGRSIVTDDYWQESLDRGITPGGKPGRAWMGVPLTAEDRTFGVMNVSSFDPDVAYSQGQLEIFSAIADQMASVMEKVRLFNASEERARQLAVLNEVSSSITSSLDLQTVLDTIMKKAVDILAAEAGSLLLLDEPSQELIFKVILGPAAERLAGQRLPLGAGIVGAVAQSGVPQIVNEAQTDNRWLSNIGQTEEFITRALLTVPMIASDKVVGVIQLLNKRDSTSFDEDDQKLLGSFAGNAAIAVENAQLFDRTDTALAQRVEELRLLQKLDRELNRSLDFSRVMNLTLEWGTRMTGAEAGSIGMIAEEEEGEGRIEIVASSGYASALLEQRDGVLLSNYELGLAGKALQSEEAQSIGKVGSDPADAPISPNSQSQISVPLRSGQSVIGVLNLESTRENAFDATQLESAIRLADHSSIAIANARLYGEVTRANDAKSEFVSIVSHELKTPMTSIKGYTDLLVQGAGGPLNDIQQQFLGTVRSNVNRMSTLVSDLLDLSRIETGRLKLDARPEVLTDLIEETLRTTQQQIDEKEQKLELDVPEDLPSVLVDRARMIQVLTNLISNAYKYTPNGGQILISANYVNNESNTNNGGSGGDCVMCAVKDSGVGISEEDQAQLFTKFFRSSDPAVRDVPGTGLGLSITKSLIEMHGGEIWVESAVGKGTTFSFSVPVALSDTNGTIADEVSESVESA